MSIGQQQRLSTLRFLLYDRPLHPELFDIHHDRHVVKPTYEAQLWVTGCAHVIGFFRQAHSLVEVIADASATLPQRGKLLELPFRGEQDHDRQRAGGISYMVNFEVETMSPHVYSRTHRELARLGARRGLFVPFPMWMSRSLTPFSFVDFDAAANSLHIFAFHAFPEELTIVKTQSLFELA